MPRLSRRDLILRASALGCSAAASPLLTPVALASLPTDNRLVVIILRGGMDGLDAVQPYGDAGLAQARPGHEFGPQHGATDLDGFFALHSGLVDLMPLWHAGELSFSHAVSTPYRDARSHFDGQDLLEAGTGNERAGARHDDGWLNRLLQEIPGAGREDAIAVGREEALIFRGPVRVASWSPEARLALSPAAEALLAHVYHDDALFRDAFDEALGFSELLTGGMSSGGADAMDADMMAEAMREVVREADRAGGGNALAGFAAERLRAEARLASFSIGGWDTHRNQPGQLTRALRRLAQAVLTLRDGLGPVWDRTTVLAMTEFGRTVRINGAGGTDHGTGGALVMAGGAVRGGRVFGDWPGLAEADLYDRRDLMPTGDVRAYAAWAMAGLFGVGQTALAARVFPGLDLGRDPGILR